jgi:hypothetical protein
MPQRVVMHGVQARCDDDVGCGAVGLVVAAGGTAIGSLGESIRRGWIGHAVGAIGVTKSSGMISESFFLARLAP